ncbi:hypothetical protein HUT06_35440 [Actinomadura sp. NAK00032]|uniref:hypothetical protein n=1 Tax=Actinomadura sp. NAK00032 TaxID=2742128 RepID=UPI0015922B1C|nr:hypothetical protein [Actinomadura sp. NAK00032]QKW38661.1 hypothetical protein HUT06_35440 [Actinomadura sp. NAK00032]
MTVNGESVPVEWGTSILVLRDASYTVRAVQGGGSSEEIAGPLAVVHSGSAGTDEPAELVYAPSGPTGQLSRSNAAPPRLRAGQRDRKDVTSPLLAVYVWGFAYSLALGPPLAALLVRG